MRYSLSQSQTNQGAPEQRQPLTSSFPRQRALSLPILFIVRPRWWGASSGYTQQAFTGAQVPSCVNPCFADNERNRGSAWG
jgi:hypothetical protein